MNSLILIPSPAPLPHEVASDGIFGWMLPHCKDVKFRKEITAEDTGMEGQIFGGGNWASSPYPGSNANANLNENQFLFDSRSAPQQLQLFGSNTGVQCPRCRRHSFPLWVNLFLQFGNN